MKVTDYRATLRAQLDIAGDAAVQMLRGEREPDAVVVLAALESASLLDEATAGPTHRAARQAVLAAARGSAVLPWLVAKVLDLRSQPMPSAELAREEEVHRWVTLAALMPLLPAGAAQRVGALLDDIQGQLLARPDEFADLAPLAQWTLDQLDLGEDHPTVALLTELAWTAEAGPVPVEEVERGYARARATLQASPILGHWFERLRGQVDQWLKQAALAPVLATASKQEQVTAPSPRQVIWTGPEKQELCLLIQGGRLLAELYPLEEASLSLNGAILEEVESTSQGALRWALPAVPPPGALELSLRLGNQQFLVRLDSSD